MKAEVKQERRSTRAAANQSKMKLEDDSFSEDSDDESHSHETIQVQETDGYQFTVSAISNALGMYKEEKTVSRILNEVRKVHAQDIK